MSTRSGSRGFKSVVCRHEPVDAAAAFCAAGVAARMRRVERRTIARLTDAGANTAERAILLERGGRLHEFVYRASDERRGAASGPGNDRYYLNAGRLRRVSRPAPPARAGRRRSAAGRTGRGVYCVGCFHEDATRHVCRDRRARAAPASPPRRRCATCRASRSTRSRR